MSPTTPQQRQRQQLVTNLLATAAAHGQPLVLAAWLDTACRVYCPITDQPITKRLRDLTTSDVRCP